MSVFYLKRGDTRPILEVALQEPDPANPGKMRAFDLSGATDFLLHVKLSGGATITRTMTPAGSLTAGVLRYTWTAADWDPLNADGFLVAGPEYPPPQGTPEHLMEYEVVGGSSRQTFPNDGWDTLRIFEDLDG